MPAVADALARAGCTPSDLAAIVCGAGPGSFTSLRIAGGFAKGFASALGRPLFAVPSLALVVAGGDLAPGRYAVAVDALRGESYLGLYAVDGAREVDELEPARVVAAERVESLAADWSAKLVGPAYAGHLAPVARGVAQLQRVIAASGPVDLASWEPTYGRLAEAQVRWEAAHGRPLPSG
jgi:tRNA threonylcarbamoyl adenosine modification protein YeaZ